MAEDSFVNPVTHDLTVGAFLNFRFALLETRILTDGLLGNGVNSIRTIEHEFLNRGEIFRIESYQLHIMVYCCGGYYAVK